MTLKILNLYAGIGGNRKLWTGDIQVTAVEINPEIAKLYQEFFPQDKVIVADAHQYLLEHYKEYDFIWASPPCPTHSDWRRLWVDAGKYQPMYPDMNLYQEIIFLQHFFKGKYCVENVIGYYEPLVKPQEVGNHYLWANFPIPNIKSQSRGSREDKEFLMDRKGFDLSDKDINDKRHLLRNCTDPEIGVHVFNMAFREKQVTLSFV